MRMLQKLYCKVRYSKVGSVAAEYALLITLIALAIAVGAGALGLAINTKLNDAAAAL